MRRYQMFMFLLLLLLPRLACSTTEKKAPPNIVFIFSDDHAYQAISAYGSNRNHTPRLDRLAEEGMLFRKAYVTNSICAPSRAVVLTGKHSHLNGVIDNRVAFDGSQQTFPKILREAGYQTAMIGKWHLKSDPTGFDYWKVLPGQGHYYNPDFKTPQGREQIEGYVTDVITDVALNWLEEERDPNRPFLLMFQHKAPHRSWWPGPDNLSDFSDEEVPQPATLFDDYSDRGSAAREQEMTILRHMLPAGDLKLEPKLVEEHQVTGTSEGGRKMYGFSYDRFTPDQREAWDTVSKSRNEAFFENLPEDETAMLEAKYQLYIKDYLRCVNSLDSNIGRLLDYLDQEGLSENTLVVYSSDQGFYLGEHGWFDKRFMYEESFRTPLIARWPGVIPAGSENHDLVQNLDFAQTFLDAAGIQAPDDMQGRSLLPLFQEESPQDWRDALYYHYYEYPAVHMVKRHYGVFDGRYKLIHFYYDVDEWELYDLEKDPQELHNIYDDPSSEEVIARLEKRLAELRKQYGDTDELTRSFLPESAR